MKIDFLKIIYMQNYLNYLKSFMDLCIECKLEIKDFNPDYQEFYKDCLDLYNFANMDLSWCRYDFRNTMRRNENDAIYVEYHNQLKKIMPGNYTNDNIHNIIYVVPVLLNFEKMRSRNLAYDIYYYRGTLNPSSFMIYKIEKESNKKEFTKYGEISTDLEINDKIQIQF